MMMLVWLLYDAGVLVLGGVDVGRGAVGVSTHQITRWQLPMPRPSLDTNEKTF